MGVLTYRAGGILCQLMASYSVLFSVDRDSGLTRDAAVIVNVQQMDQHVASVKTYM